MAELKFAGGRLVYGPRQWVPDELEDLERAGLVKCTFGFADPMLPHLRHREISLTLAGFEVASTLLAVDRASSYVLYSFRAALDRANAA